MHNYKIRTTTLVLMHMLTATSSVGADDSQAARVHVSAQGIAVVRPSSDDSRRVTVEVDCDALGENNVSSVVLTFSSESGAGLATNVIREAINEPPACGPDDDSVEFSFEWPRRIGSPFFTDVLRFTFVGSATGAQLLSRLRSAEILSPGETLDDLSARRVWEAERAEIRSWIDAMRPGLQQFDQVLRRAFSESLDNAEARVAVLAQAITQYQDNLRSLRQSHPVPQTVSDVSRNVLEGRLESACQTIQRPVAPPESVLNQLRVRASQLLDISTYILAPPTLAARTNWEVFDGRVREHEAARAIASHDLIESELFGRAGSRPVARVLQFHYRLGYISRADDRQHVRERNEVFLRVHGVPPGNDVAVSWNAVILSTTRSERGLDGLSLPAAQATTAGSAEGGPGNLIADRDLDPGPTSSLVLRVGPVETGRYRFSVCRGASTTSCAATGEHAFVVQGVRRWGFRSGFGASFARNSNTVEAIRVADDQFVVSSRQTRDMSLSIPLLGTAYLVPRQLQSNTFDLGVAGGLNLLRPTGEFYLGVHAGYGPVGLFAGLTWFRFSRPRVSPGTVLSATDEVPDLEERFGEERGWSRGVMIAVSFDFDVFRRLYEAISLKGLPTIGAGSQ